ncbi:MAG: response regulator [Candidatus Methanoplasma sp.]|jgi:CheY-like chemotaxis protein|nr:response regulator [Candidatus Methanoplasma sp.]
MKVLIIDDNLAIRNVLAEVLTDAGYEVDSAVSSDEAVRKIRAGCDIALLDMDADGGAGLRMIDDMRDEDLRGLSIILLRSWNEQVPRDNALIRGYIQKPFRSSDVLNKISETVRGEHDDRKAKKQEPKRSPGDGRVEFGKSYMFFEDAPRTVYTAAESLCGDGCEALVISVSREKAVKERVGNSNVDVLRLSFKRLSSYQDVYKLGTAIDRVRTFVERAEHPAVVFDGLDPLIERNGMNSVLMMMHRILTSSYGKKISVLASANPKNFTGKDREILLNHMTDYYEPKEE